MMEEVVRFCFPLRPSRPFLATFAVKGSLKLALIGVNPWPSFVRLCVLCG